MHADNIHIKLKKKKADKLARMHTQIGIKIPGPSCLVRMAPDASQVEKEQARDSDLCHFLGALESSCLSVL